MKSAIRLLVLAGLFTVALVASGCACPNAGRCGSTNVTEACPVDNMPADLDG